MLLPLALVDASATVVLIGLTEIDAPTMALVACALIGGFAVPRSARRCARSGPSCCAAATSCSPPRSPSTASRSSCSSGGPLLAAAIIAFVSPIAALLLSAACALTGTILFVTRKPSREWTPDRDAGSHGLLGALRSPGVVTLALSAAPVGFCFGTVEISMPAFAEQFGAARVGRRAALGLGGGERGRRPRLRRPGTGGARCRACT